jgi:HEAT repeat protein
VVQAVPPLIAALKGADRVRASAARALGNIRDARAVEPLIYVLKDMNPSVREASAHALGDMRDPRAVTALIDTLKNGSEEAGPALAQIGEPSVRPLIACLQETETRDGATEALIKIGKAATGPLIEAFQSYTEYPRLAAARALAEIDDWRAEEALNAALARGEPALAAATYKFLIRVEPPGSEDLLRQTLHAYGNPKMAEDFYRSGKPQLKAIAQRWADENSYPAEAWDVASPPRKK